MRARPIVIALMSLAIQAAATARPADANAAEGERDLAKTLAGATAGKPQSCLSDIERADGRNIPGIGILYGSGRTRYLNRFDGGCPTFSSFDIVVTDSPTGSLCRGDIARIVDPTSRVEHGSCALGDFVPYTLPARH